MAHPRRSSQSSNRRMSRNRDPNDPFAEFMSDSMFNGGMDDDDFFSGSSVAPFRSLMSGHSAMDQMFDRQRNSLGFDGNSLLSMSNGAGNFSSSTTSISFSSGANGQPSYVKTMSSKSVRDGEGNIVSESKGYEKDSNGPEKRAFQRRVNDQYHMRAKHRNKPNEEWNTEQRLVGIQDNEDDIERFHQRFRRTSESALQYQQEQGNHRALGPRNSHGKGDKRKYNHKALH